MATNAVAGFKGAILASTGSGGSVSRIAEVTNWTVTETMREIDATSHDSSGYGEVIAGIVRWSGSADALYVISDATHKTVHDVLSGRAEVDAEFYPTGSSSDGYYSGSMLFTQFQLASPNEDAFALNLTFVGNGVLARSSSST